MKLITARTVDWFTVHEFVVPVLDRAVSWPMAGSLAWQHLDDDDPVKIAALFDAARHWALRVDTAQAAMAEAISTSADWRSLAQDLQRPNLIRIPRRKIA